MSIINRDKFFEEHWDWGFLKDNGCFGHTKIEPTDVDGLVERKGQFLLIECKSGNKQIDLGQEITHKSLVNTGFFNVAVIWGNACDTNITKIKWMNKKIDTYIKNPSKEQFINCVKSWYRFANK